MDSKQLKKRVRHVTREVLEHLRDSVTDQPYDFRDGEDAILDRLVEIVMEEGGDTTFREAIRPLVQGASRDVDRSMIESDAQRLRNVHVGQTELTIPYDPEQLLVIGEGERMPVAKARREHFLQDIRVSTDNKIAQDAAFARRIRRDNAFVDALEPLDPRATAADVVRDVEDQREDSE